LEWSIFAAIVRSCRGSVAKGQSSVIARKSGPLILAGLLVTGLCTIVSPAAAQECPTVCGYSGQNGTGTKVWELEPLDPTVFAFFKGLNDPAAHESFASVVNNTEGFAGNGIATAQAARQGRSDICLYTANETFPPNGTTNVSQLVNVLDNALEFGPSPVLVSAC
jgi:hypothetical protein